MAKTIKQIANEIGVTKQSVYKRFKGKLNAACAPYVHTEDGIIYLDELGEQIIKNDFDDSCRFNRDALEYSNASHIGVLEHSVGVVTSDLEKVSESQKESDSSGVMSKNSKTNKSTLEHSGFGGECFNGVHQNKRLKDEYAAEIEFLHRQIDRLQDELEKEREHNREKDRQLLDTLTKLADTQAALAAGQSAEKQKDLAEKLIEGQQMMEGDRKESSETAKMNFEDKFRDEPKRPGILRRIWGAITNK